MKLYKKLGLGIVGFIVLLILSFFGLLAHFNLNHFRAVKAQERHLAALSAHYGGAYQPVNENAFSDIPASELSELRLNDVRFLATHNSYKQYGSAPGKLMIRLFTNQNEANALRYAHKQLTNQLESGIRSFEIDVRLRGTTFEAVHVPLVDNMSNLINLEKGFRELKLFSDHNPKHFPIITLIEFKDDWTFLDPKIRKIGDTEFSDFDRILKEVFGDKLYRPADFLAATGANSISEAVRKGWPTIESMMGKFIFIVHSGDFAKRYYAMDTTLTGQQMFIAGGADALSASFILHNNPNVAEIRALIDKGFIVRTRMDENLVRDDERMRRAMDSGAQILSSDFTISRADSNAPYTWLNNEGITITKVEPF
ncbi:MAG: hypothetical protein LBN71_09545 [Tannerella sp.]|nr:hypothetical protein [Tannerella sp.]